MRKSKYFEKMVRVEVEDREILRRMAALRDDLRRSMGLVLDDVRRVSIRPLSVDEDCQKKGEVLLDVVQALRSMEALVESAFVLMEEDANNPEPRDGRVGVVK